jgi:hypothetical protein
LSALTNVVVSAATVVEKGPVDHLPVLSAARFCFRKNGGLAASRHPVLIACHREKRLLPLIRSVAE